VFRGIGRPLSIEEVPDPVPGPDDLVLRVGSCGICGSDLHVSALPPGLPPGSVMGHEFAGEVVEVGPASREAFRVGDRVCAFPALGCGRCAGCLAGDFMLCPAIQATGLGAVPGAYAEFVRVGARQSVPLPENIDFRSGALVEPLSVGLHAVRRADLSPGENVLVIGAGPIGLAVTAWARLHGARRVVVSEKAPGRLERAARFGATHTVDAGRENVADAFARATGAAPDVVFECVGVKGVLAECVSLARPRGRIVVVGVCIEPDTLLPLLAVVKELRVDFVVAYHLNDFRLTLDMLSAGRIEGPEMVTDVVDLAGLPAAFEALRRPKHQCKELLEP
jgi:(R,R)-butanediol dehydrogenase/meso-butanediol dehydrogenase/diacetyl reductase